MFTGFIILMGLAVLIFWGCGLVLSVYEIVVGKLLSTLLVSFFLTDWISSFYCTLFKCKKNLWKLDITRHFHCCNTN